MKQTLTLPRGIDPKRALQLMLRGLTLELAELNSRVEETKARLAELRRAGKDK